jgi:hypothetical protein
MKKTIVLSALIAFTLGGCSTTSNLGKTNNGAIYEYSKTETSSGIKSCTAKATSGREIMGATIKIGADCSFETHVDEAKSPYEIMDQLIRLIPATVN